jgi:alpha-amylase
MFNRLQRTMIGRRFSPVATAAFCAAGALLAGLARGQEVSAPAILQDFESSWQTITNRTPDIFAAGYGGVYTPPPGRAQSGNQSVGYDVYDRFDLGSPGNPTLYGTATGLKTMISSIHTMGGSSYIDLVWNQSGFADDSTSSGAFAAAGGYPGFALTLQSSNAGSPGYNTQGYNVVDGDYHSAYATGDQQERLAGLVDIAQESNNQFIRQPTVAGPDNIPGPVPGASAYFYTGLANVPNPANAQFYPQPGYQSQSFYDPDLNQSFTRSSFNTSSPMTGVPTAENATGYLMRYAQYMVQVLGADGFRVDAAKNMPEWVMDYLDVATYQSSDRTLLNGQRENIFSFGEVYDSSDSLVDSYVSKSIYSGGIGNRDVEDYPLYFAMASNLTGTTSNNNWYNVVSASVDCYDPANGTQDLTPSGNTGVKFVSNQDVDGISLSSVAYAYILMMPGNATVYYNGHNFGTEAQRSFPNDGREDALGGAYGTALTTLVDLRNRFGRGNYRQDWLDTNNYAYERQGSALVMLSNNTQAGYDAVTIDVAFAPGTPLIEQTGNAHGAVADPQGNIPQLLVVNADTTSPTGASVNARFLHNSANNLQGVSNYTGLAYLIYTIPTPTGTLSLTNVAGTFGGVVPNPNDSNIEYENGTDVVSTINVIKSSSFQVHLNTVEANLLGYYRYQDADGDNAILKVDGGIDVDNDNGLYTDPSNAVTYGFEQFTTAHSPGYYANNGAGGSGSYSQTISSTQLGQGYHYITVEAFTHRSDGGPAVYTDWKETVYIDLAPPNSAPTSFASTSYQQWTLDVTSVDGLANNVHTFLDLPFGLTNAQVLADISTSNQATQEDTNLWQSVYSNLNSGNHTVTVVTYKPDGTYNIQRFTENQYSYLGVTNGNGVGLGDLNGNGVVDQNDISSFITVLESNNTQFNPGADINGDGSIDLADLFLLGPVLSAHNVSPATWTAYNNFVNGAGSNWVATHTYTVNGKNVVYGVTAGTTNVSAGSLLNASYIRGTALNIAAGGVVQIQSNPTFGNGTCKISSLSIAGTTGAWTGQLDLMNNQLVLESNAANRAADLARVINMVEQGYSNGAWTGQGITSSAAASDTTHLHALGVILNDNGSGSPLYSSFYNQSADDDAILIAYTYVGDANLDGKVDGSDYSRIDNGYLNHLTGWVNGDFNYDGVVDGSDYTLIDNAFNTQGAASQNPAAELTEETASPAAQIAGNVSVPEPCAITAIAGAAALQRRRRRFKAEPRIHR